MVAAVVAVEEVYPEEGLSFLLVYPGDNIFKKTAALSF